MKQPTIATLFLVMSLPVGAAEPPVPPTSDTAVLQTDQPKEESQYNLKGKLEFGLESNSGNTDSTDIDFSSFTELGVARWIHQLNLAASNEEAEDTRTEEEYKGAWKAIYNYRTNLYLFSNAEYEKDRIAGYDFEASETLGLGWNAIKNDTHHLTFELGAGYRHDRYLDERAHEESQLGYGDALYKLKMNDTTEFSQHVNVKTSPDKTVVLSETGLTSKLAEQWFLKVTYEFEHTDEVPEGTKHADKRTKIGLVYEY